MPLAIHHSAAVHIPLALAVLFPLLFSVIWFSMARGWFPQRTWLLLFGLSLIQISTSWLSYSTGKRDRVFSEANLEVLDRHQEIAWRFTFLWLAIVVLLPFAFIIPKRWAFVLKLLILVILGLQLFYGVQVGQLGGELLNPS